MRGLGDIRTTAGNACRAGLHRFVAPIQRRSLGFDVFARYPSQHRYLILTRMGWDHEAGHQVARTGLPVLRPVHEPGA